MTNEFKEHMECPCGISSDGFADYGEGGYHCFSCDGDDIPKKFKKLYAQNKDVADLQSIVTHYIEETDIEPTKEKVTKVEPTLNINPIMRANLKKATIQSLTHRGLNKATAKHFGVKALDTPRGIHIYFPYKDAMGVTIAVKERIPYSDTPGKEKSYQATGAMKQAVPFGMSCSPPGGKHLLICEGEIDAMSAYQILGDQARVMSVSQGAKSLKRDLRDRAVFEYVNSYENVVLCFDNDKAGNDAIESSVDLFDPNKVKIMRLKLKDVNEYVTQKQYKEFTQLFWKAEKYSPPDIIDVSSETFKDYILNAPIIQCHEYPIEALNKVTYGWRKGELVTVIADTGVGKTQFMKELEVFSSLQQGYKVGLLHLEETERDTMLGLMSVDVEKRLHLPDHGVKKDIMEESLNKFGGKVYLYKSFGSNDVDNILSKIRYLVKILGCDQVYLDHISIITSDQRMGDERVALDEIITKLKTKTVEWDFNLHMVAHINRQGEIRGTANIEKLSNTVLRLTRDKNCDDPILRNVTKLTCEKNRFCGTTGPCGYMKFHVDTGRMLETEAPDEMDDLDEF